MYSQCPDCQTRFRVTADALRAARGTVRCGRCGSAFDALERLSDMVPPASRGTHTPAEPGRAAVAAEPGERTEYHFTPEELERVLVEGSGWRARGKPSPAIGLAAAVETGADTGGESPIVVVDETRSVEDITLEGERFADAAAIPQYIRVAVEEERDLDSTDELEILRNVPDSAYPEDEEDFEREIEALARGMQQDVVEATQSVEKPAAVEEPTRPPQEAAGDESPATPTEATATATAPAATSQAIPLSAQRWRRPVADEEPDEEPARSGWGTLAWTLGALVLAFALLAQVVHHYRQDLVRHPLLGPPLRDAYDRLGIALLPNWNLSAFELRQWGNDADAATPGSMMVRASLTNGAAFAQPHPILRLELEDRFGATVASRDFDPVDYLKNPEQASRLLAPGASSEAELVLADPGVEAVGYRLDVCLRESAALLRCARGPG